MNNAVKKSKVHFNFIDVIIVCVILAVVAFAVYLFFGDKIKGVFFGEESDNDCYVRYTLSMSAVDEKYIESLTNEQELFQGKHSIGVIENIDISEVEGIELNERTSELVVSPFPNYKKVVLTIAAKAELSGNIIKIEGLNIAVGTYVEFKFPGFKSYGYITSFEKLDEIPESLSSLAVGDVAVTEENR